MWGCRGSRQVAVTALVGPIVTEVSGPTFDTPGGCDGVIWSHRVTVFLVGFGTGKGQMVRSRVELFEAIRRDHRRDEPSIRELADRHRVHRRTVRQALESAVPPPRRKRVFAAPTLDPVKPLIDACCARIWTHPASSGIPPGGF